MSRLHIQWMIAGHGGYTTRTIDLPWLSGWQIGELWMLAMYAIGCWVFGAWLGEQLGRLITKVA